MDIERLKFQDWLMALQAPEIQVSVIRSRHIVWPAAHQSRNRQFEHHQLIYVEQGILVADTVSGTFELTPGCVLWLPPDTERVLRTSDYCKTLRILFTIQNDTQRLTWTDVPEVRFHCWEARAYLEKIWRINRFGSNYKNQQLRSLIALTAINIQQHKAKEKSVTRLTVNQCQKVETFIREHLRHQISASDIAEELQMTRAYVTRLFKETYGRPPRQYIKEERLSKASALLLETNLQVKTIAREVGIRNLGLFCRLFKESFGTSPSHYRQKGWTKEKTVIGEL